MWVYSTVIIVLAIDDKHLFPTVKKKEIFILYKKNLYHIIEKNLMSLIYPFCNPELKNTT